MAAKVVHTQREDKQRIQKQLGCINGIFHLFDRRYLLGLHRDGPIQNRLTAGDGEIEFKNSSEKAKMKMKNEKNQKMMIEKNRTSVESSRNSFSSSSSSTTFSSFDCSKRVQTEWQLPSEPTSPNLHNKKLDWSSLPTDIRDVVKESMTREIRVTKYERASPVMKHIDSPRPFVQQNVIQYDKKEISRFSCDERESQYRLKSTFKVKEVPRWSLDSKQNSNCGSMNESRSELESYKRPSSGVVARLMGLDSLTDSVSEVKTLKIKPDVGDQLVSSSPRVHAKIKPEGDYRVLKKNSVYGEMEKMLGEIKFNKSGKDLRALKQILETIQMVKPDQPCSPTVKGASSPKRRELVNRTMEPVKMAREPKMITKHHDVNRTARKEVNDPILKNMNAIGGKSSARVQKPKNDVEKKCFNAPSSDSSRIRIRNQSNLKTKPPKIKSINPIQNNEKSFRYGKDGDEVSFKSKVNTHLASQRKQEIRSQNQPKENQHIKDNLTERLIEEDKPMVEHAKLYVELSPVSILDAYYTEDIPSPIRNKGNFFTDNENLQDDQTEWNQDEIYNLVNNTTADKNFEFNHVNQLTELLNFLDENETRASSCKSVNEDHEYIKKILCASSCKSVNEDHEYIKKILLASGFLQDLDSGIRIVQLHPTSSLIKPELFQLLDNQNVEDDEKIKRKLIFDSVNEILFDKLVTWNEKTRGRFMDGEKLLTDLCLEIDVLQNCSKRCLHDEDDDDDDDEVKNLVSADVNKTSENWDKCCNEVPGVVLDIERQIFKDLIDEVVNAEVARLQDRSKRRCR